MLFRLLPNSKLHFQFGRLFTLNISLYILLGILFYISQFTELRSLQIFQSLVILLIILPLTGLNIAALIEFFCRQRFSWLEKSLIATLAAFTLPPLFLSIIFNTFSLYNPGYALLFSLSCFLLAFIAHPQFLDTHAPDPLPTSLKWTFALAALVYTLVVGVVVSSYYALPDLDPYYWLRLYQENSVHQILTSLTGYRPLFSSFSSLFYGTAGIDFFAYFKYVLPFLLLTLLFPLTLIARNFQSPIHQTLVFSFPFITPSFLLYTLTPIPQAILNLGITLFCITLLHSYFSRNNFFFFTSGIFLIGISLYHEAASIVIFLWLILSLFFFKEKIKKTYLENPLLMTAVLVLLFLQFFKVFNNVFLFLYVWLKRISFSLFTNSPNFSYPATYVNIDGNAVGWGTPLGVLKYYSFYAGPVFGLLVLIAILFFLKKASHIKYRKEFCVFTVLSIFFLLLAEILPRFFNIALLPERSWGLVVLFSYAIFTMLLAKKVFFQNSRYQKTFSLILVAAFAVNIGGALYINDLKQYLVTPSQLTSAEWIKGSLPEKRVIFTYGNESTLKTHSQSVVFSAPDPSLYTDMRVFNSLLSKQHLASLDWESHYAQYIRDLEQASVRLKAYELSLEKDPVLSDASALKDSTEEFLEFLKKEREIRNSEQAIYVYYAKSSPLNPYAKRPYNASSSDLQLSEFVFDKEKEHFKRVYNLPDDEVVIWQYLP